MGDTFGAAAAFFSGGALVGIILSLYYQRLDLSLQREELKLTREELARTASAQEGTKNAMNEQVRALGRTALITAYTCLADYHDKMAASYREDHRKQIAFNKEEAEKYRNGLKVILLEIEWMAGLLVAALLMILDWRKLKENLDSLRSFQDFLFSPPSNKLEQEPNKKKGRLFYCETAPLFEVWRGATLFTKQIYSIFQLFISPIVKIFFCLFNQDIRFNTNPFPG